MFYDIAKRRLILLIAALLLALTGCGGSFDHAEYVNALLDASYKAEFDEYVKLTRSSPELAREQYDQNLNVIVSDICAALGVDASEEHREKLAAVMENILKASSYSVAGAKKVSEEEYSVAIIIKPITNLVDMEDEIAEYTDEFISGISGGESYGEINTDAIYAEFMDGLTRILENGTETITYAPETQIDIPVILDKDLKKWLVPDEEQERIFNCIISM